MGTFTHGEITLAVDEDGFMEEPDKWNEDVAAALATTEGVDDLTENHWKVVNYLRDYYMQFGVAPMIRKLCKQTGFSLKEIYELFPSGPAKGACKVAGLPKPTRAACNRRAGRPVLPAGWVDRSPSARVLQIPSTGAGAVTRTKHGTDR